MLLKSAFIALFSLYNVDTTMLQECKNETDKISGCVKRDYHSNGNLWRERPFKNGDKEGIEKWYYENGNLEKEMPFKNDKVEGIAKRYDKMGNLQIEASFLNDRRQGDIRFYITDKKLLALLKVENDKIISGKCFNDKALTNKDLAEISNTRDGEAYKYLQEICLKSDSNSTLAETLKECKNGADKISGCVKREYHLNGNLWIEMPYKNGKLNGMSKWYYENGNIKLEITYKDSKQEGVMKMYDTGGRLRAEVSALNRVLQGDTKLYTEDKKLFAIIMMRYGETIFSKCFNGRVLTDKELSRHSILNDTEKAINYLQDICLKESDS